MNAPVAAAPRLIGEAEFARISRLMAERAGVHLAPAKRTLVSSRLAGRLRALRLEGFGDYLQYLERHGAEELPHLIDALTTHETFFFREPRHFEVLAEEARRHRGGRPFRVWSAACSSGAEPWSAAMVLAETLAHRAWEVLASDISEKVLATARRGQYPIEQSARIPAPLLHRHCLKGVGGQAGTFVIGPELRARVRFAAVNLNESLPAGEPFDVVLLRNVLIYFDPPTKARVVARVAGRLRRGGLLLVGHSESLAQIQAGLRQLRPSIHRKEG